MATDIKMTVFGDIDLSTLGLQLFDQQEQSTRQKIEIALRLFQGEWFLNVLSGVPYLGSPFTDKGNKPAVDNYLRNYILDIEGVESIEKFESILKDRHYSLNFEVKVTSGEILTITDLEI